MLRFDFFGTTDTTFLTARSRKKLALLILKRLINEFQILTKMTTLSGTILMLVNDHVLPMMTTTKPTVIMRMVTMTRRRMIVLPHGHESPHLLLTGVNDIYQFQYHIPIPIFNIITTVIAMSHHTCGTQVGIIGENTARYLFGLSTFFSHLSHFWGLSLFPFR